MKRYFAFLSALLLLSGFALTSCNTQKGVKDAEAFDGSILRAGAWTINHVDVNTFDGQGNLTATQNFPFGEGTEGGICTFEYSNSDLWTLNDNGEIFSARYSVDDRVIYTDGGGTWGLRKMTETSMELVLRSDQSLNPCNYTVNGAVYYLDRAAR
jgi:predicted small secreted protein